MTDPTKIAEGLTEPQRHILRHSLGVPDPGQNYMYRNHFVTGEGSTDYPDCIALVGLGMMMIRSGSPLTGGDDAFIVTEAGKIAVRAIIQEQDHD